MRKALVGLLAGIGLVATIGCSDPPIEELAMEKLQVKPLQVTSHNASFGKGHQGYVCVIGEEQTQKDTILLYGVSNRNFPLMLAEAWIKAEDLS